jgi:hypothetical protein
VPLTWAAPAPEPTPEQEGPADADAGSLLSWSSGGFPLGCHASPQGHWALVPWEAVLLDAAAGRDAWATAVMLCAYLHPRRLLPWAEAEYLGWLRLRLAQLLHQRETGLRATLAAMHTRADSADAPATCQCFCSRPAPAVRVVPRARSLPRMRNGPPRSPSVPGSDTASVSSTLSAASSAVGPASASARALFRSRIALRPLHGSQQAWRQRPPRARPCPCHCHDEANDAEAAARRASARQASAPTLPAAPAPPPPCPPLPAPPLAWLGSRLARAWLLRALQEEPAHRGARELLQGGFLRASLQQARARARARKAAEAEAEPTTL